MIWSDVLAKLFWRKVFSAETFSATPELEPLTVQATRFHGRPANPVDPVGSITRSSHELIFDGADNDTDGEMGLEGLDIATVEVFAKEQLTPDGHNGFTLFATSVTLSPMFAAVRPFEYDTVATSV